MATEDRQLAAADQISNVIEQLQSAPDPLGRVRAAIRDLRKVTTIEVPDVADLVNAARRYESLYSGPEYALRRAIRDVAGALDSDDLGAVLQRMVDAAMERAQADAWERYMDRERKYCREHKHDGDWEDDA